MVVNSSTRSNTYGWLGKFPTLKEWVGKRTIQQMEAHGYSIANKTFEGTVGISRDDFEDDNLGIYAPIFQEMGRSAAVQPDELIFKLLKDGFTQPCYDGQNFFDKEHPVYPNVDGTGSAVNTSNIVEQDSFSGLPFYLLDCSRAVKPLIFGSAANRNWSHVPVSMTTTFLWITSSCLVPAPAVLPVTASGRWLSR